MDTDGHRERLDLVTEKIIGCTYAVASVLGNGFLEKVYENALVHELRKNGVLALQQHSIKVNYDALARAAT